MDARKCIIITIFVLVSMKTSFSMIPKPCATAESLRSKVCCPNSCGSSLGRGFCSTVILREDSTHGRDRDIRYEWPIKLFKNLCSCYSNYGGFDCSECKYGYSMDNSGDCNKDQVRHRSSLASLNDWDAYITLLNQTKYTKSHYYVITETFYSAISQPNNETLLNSIVNPNLYDLFIWVHHFVAKDNNLRGIDFAHEATGFLTWHRLFLLWMEREIQQTIPGQSEFSLSYWDWTVPSEREKYFKSGRLNVTELPFKEWSTYCWRDIQDGEICNPTVPTGYRLRRCPLSEACSSNYTFWPSTNDTDTAIQTNEYDNPPYNTNAENSFRNFLEGFYPQNCEVDDKLCINSTERKLHNSVHILLGIGNFYTNFNFSQKGVMADVAASPNDPIFFNHHTMIDCIMEEWLQSHETYNYPNGGSIPEGHRQYDYIVPFIPIYTHNEILRNSEDFGYTCSLPGNGHGNGLSKNDIILIGVLVPVGLIVIIVAVVCYVYCNRKKTTRVTANSKTYIHLH